MKVRSYGSLEEELKKILGNPHTSNNLEQAVELAEKIIKVNKTSNYANYTMGLHELALANRTAPQVNYDEAIKLLEFIVSEGVQAYYAEVNHEFPVVSSATVSATIQSLGSFKAHELNLSILGENNKRAVMVMDRANFSAST